MLACASVLPVTAIQENPIHAEDLHLATQARMMYSVFLYIISIIIIIYLTQKQ